MAKRNQIATGRAGVRDVIGIRRDLEQSGVRLPLRVVKRIHGQEGQEWIIEDVTGKPLAMGGEALLGGLRALGAIAMACNQVGGF